jgi:nitroreductase
MNKVIEAIKSRRSIRKYLPEQLKDGELQAILEAGNYAPSAHNEQSWHFTVIRNKELLDRMSAKAKEAMAAQGTDWVKTMGGNKDFHLFYHAPAVIVVSMRKAALSPLVDCAAAIENMLLAAESLDIGSHEFKSLVQQNNKTCCRIIGRYELHASNEGRAG